MSHSTKTESMPVSQGENPLKVAYVLHRFPHLTETFILQEMQSMRQQGVEIVIFSLLPPKHSVIHKQAEALLPVTHYSPWLSGEIIQAQIHFLKRSPRRYLAALVKTLWQTYREPKVCLMALALFPKSVYFARRIETLRIDHIHSHFIWLAALAAGVAADLLGISHSVHPHAFDLFQRDQRSVRYALEAAPSIITISKFNRDYIAALCPQIRPTDIEVVYCGVDTDNFRPLASQAPHTPPRILSVGQLVEKKGHEYLIDACALLAQRGIDFQCQIAGAGPRQAALQARIDHHHLQGQVTLSGALRQDQLITLYQESDVFALACIHAQDGDRDGIPVALMEAMACERPVISTPVAGIPELVRHNDTGLLVAERDTAGLANALTQLIADPELRRRLGRAARCLIVQEFQSGQNVAKLAAIFRRLGKPHRTSAPVIPPDIYLSTIQMDK
ncbi:MAG: glycosyltransferase family 4 protein [Caldilineaceae bacterium]|nr:glycosyltransferase family 4 protein [Caldilineaceae bacterium]